MTEHLGPISLSDLLANYTPGPNESWSWDDDEQDILGRECICCGEVGHYQAKLEAHLREHGLTEGVCLDEDKRFVRDGHHRIAAARRLGIVMIPLETKEQSVERWVRDEGLVDWCDRKNGDRSPWEVDLREKGLEYGR